MNRYEEIETFVRTVDAGSFTAAATQLGLAKSVASRRISDLEERLGVQLLTRSTRKLRLTDEGQMLYDRATHLIDEWQKAETLVGQQQSSLAGSIRMSLPVSFGLAHVGPAVLEFQDLHPDVCVDIEFTDRTVDLISEGYDLAVRIGDLSDSTMVARKLTHISAFAVASPQYLKQHGEPKTPNDLQTHAELRYSLRQRKSWPYTAPDANRGELEMPSVLRSNNGDFLRDASISGRGIAMLPDFIAKPPLQSGQLVRLLSDYHFDGLNAYALYPSSKHLPIRVKELVDYLIAYFADDENGIDTQR